MVCRQNAASSVAIALARSGSWLDDAQVQSIVHRLRHEFSSSQPPAGWNRATSLDRELDRAQHAITTNPNFRPQRRAGLQARLDRARTVNDGLADDTLWALSRLPDGVAAAQAALDARLGEIAGQQGMSRREARAEFHALREQAPGGRQPRANAEELRDLGAIPGDPATRHALQALSAQPPVLPPVRLVQQWVPVTNALDGADSVTHVGTSTLSDRVEVRRRDGSTAAYRMSRSDINDLEGMHARGPMTPAIVSWTERQGTRIPRAEADRLRRALRRLRAVRRRRACISARCVGRLRWSASSRSSTAAAGWPFLIRPGSLSCSRPTTTVRSRSPSTTSPTTPRWKGRCGYVPGWTRCAGWTEPPGSGSTSTTSATTSSPAGPATRSTAPTSPTPAKPSATTCTPPANCRRPTCRRRCVGDQFSVQPRAEAAGAGAGGGRGVVSVQPGGFPAGHPRQRP